MHMIPNFKTHTNKNPAPSHLVPLPEDRYYQFQVYLCRDNLRIHKHMQMLAYDRHGFKPCFIWSSLLLSLQSTLQSYMNILSSHY